MSQPHARLDRMRVNVLGVPDSSGAYCVGVERAPTALRAAGLLESLSAAGCDVRDYGDLTTRSWSPDRVRPLVQNLDQQLEAVGELAEAASSLLAADSRLLVLGGSCTVAIGVCAAFRRRGESPRVVYVDRHLDLNTPQSTLEGSLSWMGMAHALGLEGVAPELASIAGPPPLLEPSDLVYLGVDEAEATGWERANRADLQVELIGQAQLCDDPRLAASEARSALPPGPFFVHVDVDVLDFLDAPIAENVNGRNSGPSLIQLEHALVELVRGPDCRGLSLGQLDPAHAASDPTALPRLIAALSSALSAG